MGEFTTPQAQILWYIVLLFASLLNTVLVGLWKTESQEVNPSARLMVGIGTVTAVIGFFFLYLRAVIPPLNAVGYFGLFEKYGCDEEFWSNVFYNIYQVVYISSVVPVLGSLLGFWTHSIVMAYIHGGSVTQALVADMTRTVRTFRRVPRVTGFNFKFKRIKLNKGAGVLFLILAFTLPVVISLCLAITTVILIMQAVDEACTFETVQGI